MAFNGREGGEISLEDAKALTAKYREENPGATKGHFFGKDILNQILAQEDCVGIRMYYGVDAESNKELVIVGVKANEDDMTGLVADLSKPCPTMCGVANVLNS